MSVENVFEKIQHKVTNEMFERVLTQYGLELERMVVEELDKQERNVDGDLRKSIAHQVEKKAGGWLLQVGTGVKYGFFVEYGTDPHMPPEKPILRWVRKRNLTGISKSKKKKDLQAREEAEKKIADSIRWHIFHHGTKAHPFLSVVFNRERSNMAGEIMSGLIAEIEEMEPVKGAVE